MVFVHRLLAGQQKAKGRILDALANEAGFPPGACEDGRSRATAEQFSTLLRLLIERFDDEALGMLSRPLKLGSFGLIAREAISAPTLDIAIRRASRTLRLLQDDVAFALVRRGAHAGVMLRFDSPEPAANIFLHELMLRVFWRLFAWLIGGRLPVVRFEFAFKRPSHSDSYSQIFPAPNVFSGAFTAFWFDETFLNAVVCRDEHALWKFLAASYSELVVPARDMGVSGRVRRYLQQMQPKWPELVSAANDLHMAPSTLQRHLAMEGTSFQLLKNQMRRDLAIFRLHTSQIPIAKLAAELGFADCAAFQRAFKTWTGSPPGTYRRSDQ
jgi:AraC-like DNA-binding protein